MSENTAAPDLDQVKAWLGLDESDTQDDVVLQESLDAATEVDECAEVADGHHSACDDGARHQRATNLGGPRLLFGFEQGSA